LEENYLEEGSVARNDSGVELTLLFSEEMIRYPEEAVIEGRLA
jgi:hypothetical protein